MGGFLQITCADPERCLHTCGYPSVKACQLLFGGQYGAINFVTGQRKCPEATTPQELSAPYKRSNAIENLYAEMVAEHPGQGSNVTVASRSHSEGQQSRFSLLVVG